MSDNNEKVFVNQVSKGDIVHHAGDVFEVSSVSVYRYCVELHLIRCNGHEIETFEFAPPSLITVLSDVNEASEL